MGEREAEEEEAEAVGAPEVAPKATNAIWSLYQTTIPHFGFKKITFCIRTIYLLYLYYVTIKKH